MQQRFYLSVDRQRKARLSSSEKMLLKQIRKVR